MSRYLGPIHKKSKKLNFSILENHKEFARVKKTKRPVRQPRKSGFGLQLSEKQKLQYRYNLSEKPLRNLFKKIIKMKGNKMDNLLATLEKRLDNIVFRMGIASTRKAARQLVNHNHILVNNKKASIPSIILKVNDIVTIKKDKIKKLEVIKESFKKAGNFNFIELDKNNFSAKLIKEPKREDIKNDINLALVNEYYNRFI